MAESGIDAGGVNKLVSRLTSAQGKSSSSLEALEELREWLDEVQNRIEGGLREFQSGLADLRTAGEDASQSATAALQDSIEASRLGAEEKLTAAAEQIEKAQTTARTSLDQDATRVQEQSSNLEQGFETTRAAMTAAGEEDEAAGAQVGSALSDATDENAGAEQLVASAGAEAAGRFDTASSGLGGEVLAGLTSAAESAGSEVQSQAGANTAAAGGLATQLQSAYASWSTLAEEAKSAMLDGFTESAHQAAVNLLQAVETDLRQPCDRLHHDSVPTTSGELSQVLDALSDWTHQCDELSGAVDSLGDGKAAKDRIDRATD